MQKFTELNGIVAPLDRSNVDTDAIIPKQYLKSIKKSGFGINLFDQWRYQGDNHTPNPDFVLNQPRFAKASILLARENFGCGSSREHAVWALTDYGFRAVIAVSFADIFYNNCFNNSLLPIALDKAIIDRLFADVAEQPEYRLAVSLVNQTVTTPAGISYNFVIDDARKFRLLNGLDDIGLTLQHADDIKQYETQHLQARPWLA